MDYTDRLNAAMRLHGLDPDKPDGVRALAQGLGFSYQAAKKAIDGGTKMLAADNNVAAARLLRVDSEWLATGDGEPRGAKVWPLSTELLEACRAASAEAIRRAENAARGALGMAFAESSTPPDQKAKAFIDRISASTPAAAQPKIEKRHFSPKAPAPPLQADALPQQLSARKVAPPKKRASKAPRQ